MLCPQCQVTLEASKHLTIEVSHCPQCNGRWLEHGLLEQIVAQSITLEVSEKEQIIQQTEVDKAKAENAKNAQIPPRKHPHFLSGAFDVSDDW
ncbi:hypothetical protein NBRC116592_25670 [Colwellia sp. KU-HH00111]|uniref:TFIIB-type zinc ribbon-containing protein n=1 Tax=Colwellia sp. KU-HH00111 TaxID=3127652 RepID=UPI003107A19A